MSPEPRLYRLSKPSAARNDDAYRETVSHDPGSPRPRQRPHVRHYRPPSRGRACLPPGADEPAASEVMRLPITAGVSLGAFRADAGDYVVTQCPYELRPVEEPLDLLRRAAVPHVRVLEDLRQRATALVLADHVRGDSVLLA